MPVQWVVKPANNTRKIGDRCDLGDLFGADDFGVQPHEPMFGAFG